MKGIILVGDVYLAEEISKRYIDWLVLACPVTKKTIEFYPTPKQHIK